MRRGRIAIGLWLVACIVAGSVVLGNGFAGRFDASDQQLLNAMDKFTYYGIYQRGTCFSDIVQPAGEYPESDCIHTAPGSKSVLIVGDSYAAHYYRGLSETLQGTGYVLSQATKASCSYLTTGDETIPSCQDFRDYVVNDLIPRMKPDLIIYSEQWARTEASPDLTKRVAGALTAFGESGAQVVVAGPTPRFFAPVPQTLVVSGTYTVGQKDDVWLPCFDDSAVSDALAAAAKADDVQLVRMDETTQRPAQGSPGEFACLGATADGPLHWDGGHMTLAGSELYADYLWTRIAKP